MCVLYLTLALTTVFADFRPGRNLYSDSDRSDLSNKTGAEKKNHAASDFSEISPFPLPP